jgi:unsaturated rhamnogalacturonyl hydrolase
MAEVRTRVGSMRRAYPPRHSVAHLKPLAFLSALVFALPGHAGGQVDSPMPSPAAPFAMRSVTPPRFPPRVFDIRSYGATEGGSDTVTGAIRRAIAGASRQGGGRVLIPSGNWLTGAIHLDDNIELHLDSGAVLRFSRNFDDYLPVVLSRHEGIECFKHSAFVYARGKSNIAITGEGILDGQGSPWWPLKQKGADAEELLRSMASKGIPVEHRVFDGARGRMLRPAFFQPLHCRNVLVEGVTFRFGAFWTVAPTYCEDVIIRNITVVTRGPEGTVPNGDGVDISSCNRVLVEGCRFDTGDDCICVKSGRDTDGLRVNIPSENIVIRHCTGNRGHGGIVLGSETSGGIRNIYAHDCAFNGTDRMIRLKTARGRGGVLENIWFRNITGENIQREAIRLNMLYEGTRFPEYPVSPTTPAMRNIHFSGIECRSGNGRAVEIIGLPERSIDRIFFDSLAMTTRAGFAATDASDISLLRSTISPLDGPLVALTDCIRVECDVTDGNRRGLPILEVLGAKSSAIEFRPPRGDSSLRIVPGDDRPWSERIALSFLARHPDGLTCDSASPDTRWNYEQGLMLVALLRMGEHTGDPWYARFVRRNLEAYVGDQGQIRTYDRTSYNLDNISPGRALLATAASTGESKFRLAADTLRAQIREQPRTSEGGFWHKLIYPHQMWLDGLFMAEPFYASYARSAGEPADFDDIARQFLLAYRHMLDRRTGLLFHAWDESRSQRWADPATGCSPNFWSRSLGWYLMGLVDVLDDLPAGHRDRDSLVAIFKNVARAVRNVQDPASHVWFQVPDQALRAGNYLEASASCMFVYAFARGVAGGLLDSTFLQSARDAYAGIIREFVTVDRHGFVDLHHVCRGAGLGGTPYRDGSFSYYIGEPQRTNDMKGVGSWLLASIALERLPVGPGPDPSGGHQ